MLGGAKGEVNRNLPAIISSMQDLKGQHYDDMMLPLRQNSLLCRRACRNAHRITKQVGFQLLLVRDVTGFNHLQDNPSRNRIGLSVRHHVGLTSSVRSLRAAVIECFYLLEASIPFSSGRFQE